MRCPRCPARSRAILEPDRLVPLRGVLPLAPHRASALALAVLLTSLPASASASPSASQDGTHGPAPQPSPEGPAAAAKAEVERGRAAAGKGDFATALTHFERALKLRPAPSLHFNIAVCHHNLMLAAGPGSTGYESARGAAIEAYRRYMEAAPDADDRDAVAATIESLGGRPPTDEADQTPWVIERIDPDDVPLAPSLHEEPTSTTTSTSTPTAAPTSTPTARTDLPGGRIGPFIPLSLINLVELSKSDTMRAVPGIGLGLRGGALLGARHRVGVGGEVWATGQPISAVRRPVLVSGGLLAAAEYAHPLAGGRFEIGAGGGLGLVLQSLRYSGDTPPVCAVADKGTLSARVGALLLGRLVLSALLGKRRNHELSLRLSPGIAAVSRGSKKSDDQGDDAMNQMDPMPSTPCSELSTPFQSVGLSGAGALVVLIDLGYAPRF